MEGIKYITDDSGQREAVVIDLNLYGEQAQNLLIRLEQENSEAKWLRSSLYVNALMPIYCGYIRKIKELSVNSYEKVSSPLLISVHEDYRRANLKIMFVGKETNGGLGDGRLLGSEAEIVNNLLECYEGFDMAQHSVIKSLHRKSPFWRFIYALSKRINNHNEYRRDFIWTNLSKVDQGTNTPSFELLELLQKHDLNLLKEEVGVLKPDVVVFLTGWSYHQYMKKYLNISDNINLEESNYVKRVEIKGFPDLTYCTYHPRYLSTTKNFELVLKAITAHVDAHLAK